jgi:SulP family sulfate permease
VVAALAVHVWREMRVPVPAGVEDGALHLRPTGVLYFGSAPGVERALNRLIAGHPDVDRVVLHLDGVGRLDLTGALMLRDLLEETRVAGRTLEIQGARAHAAKLLTRILGPDASVSHNSRPR